MCEQNGIAYELTGETTRGQRVDYHCKLPPLKLNKTKYKVDVAGLRKREQRDSLIDLGGDYETKFTIGMEVEKEDISRSSIFEYRLFCGFERDSSCGTEAVTHILPLLPRCSWRTKIYNLMYQAERVIDDRWSPSNSDCGGHITVACEGMGSNELLKKMRKYSGILMYLYRNRLKNTYCSGNLNMRIADESNNVKNMRKWGYCFNGQNGRYNMVLAKSNGTVEYRLVSRFTSVQQMMRRYELFYELMDTAVNYPRRQHKVFYAKIRPILEMMYNNDEYKVDKALEYAQSFDNFINDGVIDANIQPIIDVDGYNTGRWTQCAIDACDWLYDRRQDNKEYGWKKDNWK
tara:strand:+ start:3130 stop:4167 length:1038 start_codon:yes stop_codon:yes gene_type:complete